MELDMVCVCKADGVREAESRRLRIFHRMGLDEMSELTGAIVLSLAFDFQAQADVYADQWFGVDVSTPLLEDGVYVQCDWPYDGLASIWEHLAEKFPERVTVNPTPRASHVRVAERISAALLAQYEQAEALYREHRKAAHNGDNDCPPCEDCSVGSALSITAAHALDESWGTRVLDIVIDKAFEDRFGPG